jgi:signal transduction histidine kinase
MNDVTGMWPGRLVRLIRRGRPDAVQLTSETIPIDDDLASPVEALRAQLADAGYPVEASVAPDRMLSLLLASFEELSRSNEQLAETRRALAEIQQRERTARVRAEELTARLERLVREAEAANGQRARVIASLAHDLKNPIGTIYTSAAMLLEIPLDEEQRRRQLEVIRRTADRLNQMIQDEVDVSRIDAGTFVIDMVPERTDTIIAGALERLEPLATARQVGIVAENAAGNVFVLADRGRVLQVLSNVVGHALEYSTPGSAVSIRSDRNGDVVRFTIIGEAPAIPAEQLPRLFDRPARASSARESGSGLAIAKAIVQAHGGEIRGENGESGGTRVHFTLPVAPQG